MAQYVDAFLANDIDTDVLSESQENDLEKLAITSLGHRKKISTANGFLNASAAEFSDKPRDDAQATPRFTEGFVTMDLRDANRLLSEL